MFSATLESKETLKTLKAFARAVGKRNDGKKALLRFRQNDCGNVEIHVQYGSGGTERYLLFESVTSICNGEMVVYLHDFVSAMGSVSGNYVNVEEDGGFSVILSSNTGSAKAPVATVETFKDSDIKRSVAFKPGAEMETKYFFDILKRVAPVADSEKLFTLHMIHFEPERDSTGRVQSISVVASNGFRLMKKNAYFALDKTVNLDKYDAEVLLKLDSVIGDWLRMDVIGINAEEEDGYITFSGNGIRFITPACCKKFPDWKRVQPTVSHARINIYDTKEFIKIINSAEKLSTNDSATLTVNGKIQLMAGGNAFIVDLENIADSTGEGKVIFNPSLMKGLLNPSERETEVSISETQNKKMLKIRNAEAKEVNLVMEIRG